MDKCKRCEIFTQLKRSLSASHSRVQLAPEHRENAYEDKAPRILCLLSKARFYQVVLSDGDFLLQARVSGHVGF